MPEISATWRGSRGPGPPSAVRAAWASASTAASFWPWPSVAAVIDQAQATSTVGNAIVQGGPVTLAGAAS